MLAQVRDRQLDSQSVNSHNELNMWDTHIINSDEEEAEDDHQMKSFPSAREEVESSSEQKQIKFKIVFKHDNL